MATAHTFHTYPDLIFDGGRLAETIWASGNASAAVAATLRQDSDSIVLFVRVGANGPSIQGLAPGGLGVCC